MGIFAKYNDDKEYYDKHLDLAQALTILILLIKLLMTQMNLVNSLRLKKARATIKVD